MATFYLILVIILFILAVSDLVVGVSNDAVNFLNASVGSRVSSLKVIIFVAALGVLVGSTFSSGMMEVARTGIFNPEHFYFSEIMIIFLTVMITDVILLDAFNTYGMPTSTTVSIVFELLGSAVAISLMKTINDPNALPLLEYINSGKALAIISGILVSVALAFTAGLLAQYISRMLFSFDYEKRMKQIGFIWGGIGVTGIAYFMLIKGAKGASFLSSDFVTALTSNTIGLLSYTLIGSSLLLYFINRFLGVDILKVLVLFGTFALSMAFAGNDLVNFIGVPLAGYNSYELYVDSGYTDPDVMKMSGLAGQVPTPTLLLLISGIIMVLTLYLSRKARSVLQTSVNLGRQDEGYEKFGSVFISRATVRFFSSLSEKVSELLPSKLRQSINDQFDQTHFIEKNSQQGEDAPAFDMIRASVTLVVASSLIAIGTNLKLPLSTTYVTFMVFMGASLADGAWGRESAVYRVTGVLTVIGGWFFTALSAFTLAFILALLVSLGGELVIALLLIIASYVMYRTHRYHKQRSQEDQLILQVAQEGDLSKTKVISLCSMQLKTFLIPYGEFTKRSLLALGAENLSVLNQVHQSFKTINSKIQSQKTSSSKALDKISEHEIEAGHVYILVIDYLAEMAKNIKNILKLNLDHVDNNHKPVLKDQIEDLLNINNLSIENYNSTIEIFKNPNSGSIKALEENLISFVKKIRIIRKKQIKRIKNHEVGTRNSVLIFNILSDLRNNAMFNYRILKVFDELFLNPIEQESFNYRTIKGELKEMRKDAKRINDDEINTDIDDIDS